MSSIVLIAFLAILASLGTALFFMLRGNRSQSGTPSRKMAWALGARIGLSILLFGTILLAWKLGYIHPTGIQPGQ
jgi:hypothetical protein